MLYSERGGSTAPVSVQPAPNNMRTDRRNKLRKSDRSRERSRNREGSRNRNNRGSSQTRQVLIEMLHVSDDDYGCQTTRYVSVILHSRILLMYGVVLIIIMVCLLKQAFSIREFHSTFSYLF